jgi:NADPH:quinone reductase-like Zn-dependent oxidoreductase
MVQAIRFEKTGGQEILTPPQVSVDKPGPGQVRPKHTAVRLNSAKFGDQIHRLPVTRPRLISRGSHHRAQGSLS